MRTLLSLLLLLLSGQLKAQKSFVCIGLTGGTSGIIFTNDEDKKLPYTRRLSTGWHAGYTFLSGAIMVDSRIGFTRLESQYNDVGISSSLSMDFFRTSFIGSLITAEDKIRIKVGTGFSTGHLFAGEQRTNTITTDLITNKVYNQTELASIIEVGAVFQPDKKTLIQFCYFFRRGLTDMEKNNNQTTKTIGNGMQMSVHFGL